MLVTVESANLNFLWFECDLFALLFFDVYKSDESFKASQVNVALTDDV